MRNHFGLEAGEAGARSFHRLMLWVAIAVPAVIAAAVASPAIGGPEPQLAEATRPSIVVPDVDAARGRDLFVMKGCVTCHSVNEVGGKAAPALDAPKAGTTVDLLDFAARMWSGATAMQELQSIELGYRIDLDGGEIGDLAAFAGTAAAQSGFSIDEIPDLLKDWFIDEPYWEEGNWPETEEWQFPERVE